MSDDDIIVGSEVVPGPSEYPKVVHVPDDGESRDEIVKDQFNVGLTLAARGTESAADYIKERQTQEKFFDGADLSPAEVAEWHQRAHASLSRAADQQARARGEAAPSEQQAPRGELPNYVAPDAPDYDQHFEAARQRFSDYFDNPNRIGDQNTAAEHKANVTEWLSTSDPKGELTGYFMGSELGPVMAEALASQPEVIPHLLSLPPAQQSREMAKLEGFIAAKVMDAQQNYAPPEPQPRRQTAAPPPINPPRGAANVPKDLFSLATKSDVRDYVETRRKQEHQAWQDRQLDGWRR